MAQKPHQTVQIVEGVLYGCAGEAPSACRLDHAAGVRHLGQGVLDGVRLVEDHPAPHHAQHAHSRHRWWGGVDGQWWLQALHGRCRMSGGTTTTAAAVVVVVASSGFGQQYSVARHHHVGAP